VIYAIATGISSAGTLVMVLLAARLLEPAEYGFLALLLVILEAGRILCRLGVGSGVFIAYMAARLADVTENLTKWSEAKNPFFDGPTHHYADALSLIPFIILTIILYLTGREVFLSDKSKASRNR